MSPRAVATLVTSCIVTFVGARSAAAEEARDGGGGEALEASALSKAEERALRRLEVERGASGRFFAQIASGTGVRFNNPYRLGTVLGEDASSTSLLAPFFEVAATYVYGPSGSVQHGASVRAGGPLVGVVQPYVTPSYVFAYREDLPVLIYGRVGTPLLLAPDFNVGAEVAASVSYFFSSGLGLTSEVMFDLFYGAATLDDKYSTIPVLAFSLGVIADVEVLP
jgi:hypothetical protein